MLAINGVSIHSPSEFSVEIEDLDGESNRNARGQLMRDRIAVKRKLSCKWPALSNAALSNILMKVKSEFFSVTYPDPETGTNVTKTFYVGTRTAAIYKVNNGVPAWEGLEMNFVER